MMVLPEGLAMRFRKPVAPPDGDSSWLGRRCRLLFPNGGDGGRAPEMLEPNCRMTAPNNEDFSAVVVLLDSGGWDSAAGNWDRVSANLESAASSVDW